MSLLGAKAVQTKVDKFYNTNKNGGEQWWQAYELVKKGMKIKITFAQEGKGDDAGLSGLAKFLSDKKAGIYRCIMRIQSEDDHGSKRQKYFFIKFQGTGAPVMAKSLCGQVSGKVDKCFTTKHKTMDIDENDMDELEMKSMGKLLLRVGGAHKPDKYVFGPGEEFRTTLGPEAVGGDEKKTDEPAPKKAEPKKAEPKKAEPKKEEPKKEEPKEEDNRKLSIDDPPKEEEAADKAEEAADEPAEEAAEEAAEKAEDAAADKEEELSIDN